MNKNLFASDAEIPPLLMLSLAVISLIFNLCFPQYSAIASTGNQQKFMHEDDMKDKMIALNKALEVRENINNDKIAAREVTYSELKLEPDKPKAKTKVIAQKKNAQPSTGAKSKWVTVTAYSSTVEQCDSNPFVTASGTRVRDGIIATNLLAFGTKVKFPSLYGDKIFTVEDRMSQRFTNRADIWFESTQQAKQFGVRQLEMIIVS